MRLQAFAACILLGCFSCRQGQSQMEQSIESMYITSDGNPYPHIGAIPLPMGYKRIGLEPGSYGAWLRQLELKEDKTVYLYNGSTKRNQTAQFAVLNVSVGHKDLQQCADAVMRLRAEYLYSQKRYDEIIFTDNEQTNYLFEAPYTRMRFDAYLQRVFGMCGSASLSRQLHSKNIWSMQPGDVLIKGGFPGHAVMVMDMAQNDKGEKIYLLAQSYMPAQDIHILNNPSGTVISPWYRLNSNADITTPEYYFTRNQLKGW